MYSAFCIVYRLGEETSYLQFTVLNCSTILRKNFHKIYWMEHKGFCLNNFYFCSMQYLQTSVWNFIAPFRTEKLIKSWKGRRVYFPFFQPLRSSEAGKEVTNLFKKLWKIKPSFSVSEDRGTTVDVRKKPYCLQDSFRVQVVET